jgi:hypothetical protein
MLPTYVFIWQWYVFGHCVELVSKLVVIARTARRLIAAVATTWKRIGCCNDAIPGKCVGGNLRSCYQRAASEETMGREGGRNPERPTVEFEICTVVSLTRQWQTYLEWTSYRLLAHNCFVS